jgi:hypothetical protein
MLSARAERQDLLQEEIVISGLLIILRRFAARAELLNFRTVLQVSTVAFLDPKYIIEYCSKILGLSFPACIHGYMHTHYRLVTKDIGIK